MADTTGIHASGVVAAYPESLLTDGERWFRSYDGAGIQPIPTPSHPGEQVIAIQEHNIVMQISHRYPNHSYFYHDGRFLALTNWSEHLANHPEIRNPQITTCEAEVAYGDLGGLLDELREKFAAKQLTNDTRLTFHITITPP